MPFYTFHCERCDVTKDELVRAGTESTTGTTCGTSTVKQPSFRFSAHGLPNGFSANRSASRKE